MLESGHGIPIRILAAQMNEDGTTDEIAGKSILKVIHPVRFY